jgi:hypothetical protein
MELIGQEQQLYAGRRICDGHEVQICLVSAGSRPEAFDRLAHRMFATRLVDKQKATDSPLVLSPEQIEPVLWEGERFDVFPVVFDPTGIAPIADVRWG